MIDIKEKKDIAEGELSSNSFSNSFERAYDASTLDNKDRLFNRNNAGIDLKKIEKDSKTAALHADSDFMGESQWGKDKDLTFKSQNRSAILAEKLQAFVDKRESLRNRTQELKKRLAEKNQSLSKELDKLAKESIQNNSLANNSSRGTTNSSTAQQTAINLGKTAIVDHSGGVDASLTNSNYSDIASDIISNDASQNSHTSPSSAASQLIDSNIDSKSIADMQQAEIYRPSFEQTATYSSSDTDQIWLDSQDNHDTIYSVQSSQSETSGLSSSASKPSHSRADNSVLTSQSSVASSNSEPLNKLGKLVAADIENNLLDKVVKEVAQSEIVAQYKNKEVDRLSCFLVQGLHPVIKQDKDWIGLNKYSYNKNYPTIRRVSQGDKAITKMIDELDLNLRQLLENEDKLVEKTSSRVSERSVSSDDIARAKQKIQALSQELKSKQSSPPIVMTSKVDHDLNRVQDIPVFKPISNENSYGSEEHTQYDQRQRDNQRLSSLRQQQYNNAIQQDREASYRHSTQPMQQTMQEPMQEPMQQSIQQQVREPHNLERNLERSIEKLKQPYYEEKLSDMELNFEAIKRKLQEPALDDHYQDSYLDEYDSSEDFNDLQDDDLKDEANFHAWWREKEYDNISDIFNKTSQPQRSKLVKPAITISLLALLGGGAYYYMNREVKEVQPVVIESNIEDIKILPKVKATEENTAGSIAYGTLSGQEKPEDEVKIADTQEIVEDLPETPVSMSLEEKKQAISSSIADNSSALLKKEEKVSPPSMFSANNNVRSSIFGHEVVEDKTPVIITTSPIYKLDNSTKEISSAVLEKKPANLSLAEEEKVIVDNTVTEPINSTPVDEVIAEQPKVATENLAEQIEEAPLPEPSILRGVADAAFYVQIASLGTQEAAEETLHSLINRYRSVLQGHRVMIQQGEVADRGTFYRLRVPFDDNQSAKDFCSQYKDAGGSCFVSSK